MIKIIDSHLHIWDRNYLNLPWLDGDKSVLSENYSLDDYTSSLKGENLYSVEGAVYVEVDVLESQKDKENNFILEICKDGNTLIKGASISGNLTESNFAEYIGKYKSSTYLKGVRQVLHVSSAKAKTCLSDTFIENVKLLGQLDLLFEACLRVEELDDLYLVAQQCSETTIVLNHMGIVNPDVISSKNPSAEEIAYRFKWISNLEKLAGLPNVVCKISGLNPAGLWNVETLRESVNIALDIFKEDKVMFASNYPVCNIATGMDPWIRALIEITKDRRDEFVNKLFYENARNIYKLYITEGN